MGQDTKERILQVALDLFSRRGYEAVSVRDIAGELGMSQAVLYKHYLNKQAILDAVVARMEEADRKEAEDAGVPADPLDGDAASQTEYAAVTPAEMRDFTLQMVSHWTADPFASRFSHMLQIERHRDPAMETLFQQYLGTGPLSYTEDILGRMAQSGTISCPDPHAAALEFYATAFSAFVLADALGTEGELLELVGAHIDRFFERHGAARG